VVAVSLVLECHGDPPPARPVREIVKDGARRVVRFVIIVYA